MKLELLKSNFHFNNLHFVSLSIFINNSENYSASVYFLFIVYIKHLSYIMLKYKCSNNVKHWNFILLFICLTYIRSLYILFLWPYTQHTKGFLFTGDVVLKFFSYYKLTMYQLNFSLHNSVKCGRRYIIGIWHSLLVFKLL